MIPAEFEYHAPTTTQEAVQLLQQYGDEAKVLAGGHSLVPLLRLRLASPAVLVDINRIADLRGITRSNGTVTIGAMTTHATIEHSEGLKQALPILPAAATLIGDPMVRNRGTFGGSLAHADPAGDWPAVALALGAQMHILGPDGERTVPVDEFFVGLLTSAVEPGELLTHVSLPMPTGRVGMSYQKFAHPASGYAVTGVAALVTLGEDGICADCRVAITGAGDRATRATETEAALQGQVLNETTIARAAEHASSGVEFLGDIYASETYREQLVKVYAKRALLAALQSADSGERAAAQKTL
ncbi:MAG: xanthine dehydrogenase family protein subunit M [Chloroflexota bacterium]|nr:xanthine dehydrogenase family protein subunit M [Chloroflexota bacterium]